MKRTVSRVGLPMVFDEVYKGHRIVRQFAGDGFIVVRDDVVICHAQSVEAAKREIDTIA